MPTRCQTLCWVRCKTNRRLKLLGLKSLHSHICWVWCKTNRRMELRVKELASGLVGVSRQCLYRLLLGEPERWSGAWAVLPTGLAGHRTEVGASQVVRGLILLLLRADVEEEMNWFSWRFPVILVGATVQRELQEPGGTGLKVQQLCGTDEARAGQILDHLADSLERLSFGLSDGETGLITRAGWF